MTDLKAERDRLAATVERVEEVLREMRNSTPPGGAPFHTYYGAKLSAALYSQTLGYCCDVCRRKEQE